MGLFDKLFSTAPSQITYSPKNEQEATMAIMYACMATDGDVSDIEIDTLARLVGLKKNFQGHDIVAYHKTVLLTHQQIGSKNLIDSSVNAIPIETKPTIFAMVMEILLADGILAEKEREIAEYLASKFSLDEELSQKIVEVILIKNKGAIALLG